MNDLPKSKAPGKRESLEQEAERVRSRLLGDLDELKARGRSVGDQVKRLEETARRHPGLLIGAGALALAAFGFALYARGARRRRARQRDAILGLAARVLGPAYVVEPAAHRNGAVKQSLKKATRALVAAAGREVGRRALLAVTAASTTEPRPMESRAPA